MVKTVNAVSENQYKEISQDHLDATSLKHAPKIFKETCAINWDQSNEQVFNLIRGLSPYPTAFTQFMDKGLKIYLAEKEAIQPEIAPGSFLSDHKTYLKFATKNGFIHLKEIQQEGKKRMTIAEFLRGQRIS